MEETSITLLLDHVREGRSGAQDRLLEAVYGELRRLAASHMNGERPGHTMQATALVNEAFLRLGGLETTAWKGRAHFFATAAQIMRRILVDHARTRDASKRGGRAIRVELSDTSQVSAPRLDEILSVDQALEKLARIDERQSRIVEMRYFGGLTEDEIAEVLEVSSRTVKREWKMARAWLLGEMKA